MVLRMTKSKGTKEQELLQMIIQMIQSPPYLCKWSLAKRTVLQMTKIKGTERHGLLQMTIWMIWPPLCSSVPLQIRDLHCLLGLVQPSISIIGEDECVVRL